MNIEINLKEILSNITKFEDFIKFQIKLHKYPLEEALQIYMQYPDTIATATFEQWNKIGRRINRGSRHFKILDIAGNIKKLFPFESTNGKSFDFPINTELPQVRLNEIIKLL